MQFDQGGPVLKSRSKGVNRIPSKDDGCVDSMSGGEAMVGDPSSAGHLGHVSLRSFRGPSEGFGSTGGASLTLEVC